MLDLVKKDPAAIAEAGYEFTLTLPDGTETDAKVKVRGSSAPAVRAHAKRVYNEMQMRIQAARKRGKEPEEISIEEAEQMAAKNAAVRVIGWSGVGENGKEIEFTPAEAERLFAKYPFFREQVMEESEDLHNFRFD